MKEKSKKKTKVIAITLVSLTVLGVSMVACGRSLHRHSDPEKIEKFVMWKVNDRLDDLDVNEQQRKEIVSSTKTIIADLRQIKMRHEKDNSKGEILNELKKGEPDVQKYHRLLDEHLDNLRGFAHRSLDTALRAFMVLDTNQRSEVIEEVEEHIAEHHSS